MEKQELKPKTGKRELTIEESAWILMLKRAYQNYLDNQREKNGN